MKFRSFVSTLLVLSVVLLAMGIGGFVWLFSQNPLRLLQGSPTTTPAAAMFVSRQAPLMASLLVNPDRLAAFRTVIATPGERKQAQAEVAQLKQALLANTGLDYTEDVQPWLGDEVTLAISTLDIDRDLENGRQPGYLLVLSAKDPERAREFLQLYWQKRAIAGTDLVFEQYKGVKLIYGKVTYPESGVTANNLALRPLSILTSPNVAAAAVGDRYLLFANYPKVLRDAINNVQAPDLSLETARPYQQAIAALKQPRIGLSYVNLPGLVDWLAEETALPGQKPTATELKPGSTAQALTIALQPNRQGLLAETALIGTTQESFQPKLAGPVTALQYIPMASPIAASGVSLDRLWSGVTNDPDSTDKFSQIVDQALTSLQKRWQIDVPQEVFAWVKGEYAIALLPNQQPQAATKRKQRKQADLPGLSSTSPFSEDWVFVAERKGTEAKDAIAHLDDLARQQGLSVGPVQLGEQTVSAWTQLSAASAKRSPLALQATIQGVHTTVGNYEIFATSLAAMAAALQADAASIVKQGEFQQAIAPLQQPNNGYLYLDWQKAQPILEAKLPVLKVVELAIKPLVQHLDALSISGYGSSEGIQRSGIFLKLSEH
ncbi:MAG TPA: DUF3352 domain-containing protein [Leptolyngbyaceae cyanobacterium M33_DOE_097]|uniref:DUF3352 domain-containing protein n=1 Tax=Oscillatoriales cyanobacterium SpSt-418 TaxID=2282169 RepID=A0A7C3PFM3_9CYAN|nr:DUF3352 domain-containing protein [Leptolyngbyaceae cyanobacterium M33_DOE_097]